MNNLLGIAVELMLLGMGTVFVFLTVLILATRLMSSLVLRVQPELKSQSRQTVAPAVANPAQDKRLIQIIEEAIKQHRNQ